MAAMLTKAKGQEDEEDEDLTWWEWMALMFFIVAILGALWLCLKEGVPQSSRSRSDDEQTVRSLPRPPQGSTVKLRTMRRKEESEDEEEEMKRPAHLPSPIQSPVPLAPRTPRQTAAEWLHTPTQSPGQAHIASHFTQSPVTQVTIWGRPSPSPQPRGQVSSRGQEVERKKEKEEEKKRREEEEKERSRGAASSSDPASAATTPARAQGGGRGQAAPKRSPAGPTPSAGDEEDPVVLTTRFGRAHHGSMECGYIRAPRTGEVRRSRWCPECKRNMVISRDWNLWMNYWGGHAHINRACSKLDRGEVLRYTPRSQCATLESQRAG